MNKYAWMLPCLLLVSTLLAFGFQTAGQRDQKTREERNREFRENGLPIVERAEEKLSEARILMKLKKFQLAEDRLEESLRILDPVPTFKRLPMSAMGELRMLQGRYQDALDIWEELHPEIRTIGNPIAEYMEICYARTNQLEKGYALFVDSWKRGCQCYHATLEQMPVFMKPSIDSLEASALMLLIHNQVDSRDLEESAKRAERAASLVPKSAAANFCAAQFLDWRMKDMVQAMPFYRRAYALGNGEMRTKIEKRMKGRAIKIEALIDPSIPIKNRRGSAATGATGGSGG